MEINAPVTNIETLANNVVVEYLGYMNNGRIVSHSFDDKPAQIETCDGKKYETWCCHGRFHRITGPAMIYTVDGKVRCVDYWVDGKVLDEEQFSELYLITFLEEYKPSQGI